ncbi:hypothetical protein [Deinococcus multiflagellatus]|uniref:Uncharacterized protein n=1 Tax=Deinococcus multiflagellatus TaxID=1656887 RepID=A0ABW1ZQ33_9DEIO
MFQISKPADGLYLYPAPITGTETIATWQDGRLTTLVEGGEARAVITALTEAHTAHEIIYLDDVVFTPPSPRWARRRPASFTAQWAAPASATTTPLPAR